MAQKASDYDFGLKNGVKLDIPVDLSELLDANGNEALEIDTVTSAVNYVRLANSATGNNPALSAQGDDTNISLQLSPSGTGLTLIGDTSTGTVNGPTGTASVTINAQRGVITTAALTTGSATASSFSLVNSKIGASSQVLVNIYNGSNSQGFPIATAKVATAGSAYISILNPINAAAPLNGSVVINFLVAS